MIARVRGKLAGLTARGALLDLGAVTLEVGLTALDRETVAAMPVGSELELYTLFTLEGAVGGSLVPNLVGFRTAADREVFQLLTTVDGIGPAKALKALTLPAAKVAAAVEAGDVRTLAGLKGVGQRTAEKIVASLRGKMTHLSGERGGPGAPAAKPDLPFYQEAREVLAQLGYTPAEADRLIRAALERNPQVAAAEELVAMIFQA